MVFNVKQLFLRRRKYDRVVGGQQDEWDVVGPGTTRQQHTQHKNTQSNGRHYHLEMSSESAKFNGSSTASSATVSSSSGLLWGFKMRPKLHMRKQKSLKLVRTSPSMPPPSQAAVQNFLQGPSQGKAEDEDYQQQCRDLLRKLSARGNRVPGFM